MEYRTTGIMDYLNEINEQKIIIDDAILKLDEIAREYDLKILYLIDKGTGLFEVNIEGAE